MPSQPLNVLIVEDNPNDAELVLRELRRAGYHPEWKRVQTKDDFLAQLSPELDLILSDYDMPGFSGPQALELLQQRSLCIPFIIISGTIGEDVAVEVMKMGATDYLLKDRLMRLGLAIGHALEKDRARREHDKMEAELRSTHAQLQRLLDHSPSVFYSLKLEGQSPVPQLISENVTNLLGFSVEEACNSEWWSSHLHPEDRQRAFASITETLDRGGFTCEYRIQHKVGSYVWVEDHMRLILDAAGQPAEIAGTWIDISERKRVEAALQRQQTELRVLFDLMPALIWFKDTNNHFLRANQRVVEATGRPIEEIEGKSAHEIYPQEADGYYLDDLEVIRSGVPKLGIVEKLRGPEGQDLWVQTDKVPYCDKDGKVIGIVVMAQDVTERKRAATALQESQRFLQSTLDALTSHIAILDEGGTIIAVNAAWNRFAADNGFAGLHRGVGDDYLQTCDEAFGGFAEEAAAVAVGIRSVTTGQREEFHLEYPCHSPGEQRWFIVRATRFGGEGPVRVVVAHDNITERRLAEDAMRESEERFSGAFEFAPIGVALASPEGRWLKVNRALCDIVGYTEAEMLKLTFQSITHADDLADSMDHAHRLLAGEIGAYQLEKCYVHASGNPIAVLLNVSLMRDPEGQPHYFIAQIQDITDRKRSEAALQRQQTELRVLFDLMPAMIWFKDTENGILRVNKRVAEIAGKSVAEIEGRPSIEVYPEEAARFYADDLEVIRSGVPKLGYVETVHGPEGQELWVQTDKVPYCDQDGKVIGIVVMAQDITERKHSEEAVRQSQKRLRDIIDGLGPAVFVGLLTPEGNLIEVNHAPLAAAGLKPEDVLGKPFEETHWWSHSLESRVQLRDAITRAARGEASRYDVRTQGVGTDTIDIDFSLQPLRNPNGKVVFLIPSAIVITDRKRAEMEVKFNEQRFRSLVEATTAICWDTPPSGEFEFDQPGWRAFTGQSFEELRGTGWLQAIHPDDQAETLSVWAAALANRSIYEVEHRVKNRDQTYHDMSVRAVPILAEDGTIRQWIGMHSDITERKQMERQFLRAQRMESIGTLAGGIAHDLNNVLAPIMMSIDLLKLREKDPTRLNILATIAGSAKRGADMVQQVLSFARGVEGEKVEVDLGHVLKEIEKISNDTFLKNIQVNCSIPTGLWTVQGDPTQLHQVLLNLCVNARDAMPQGGMLTLTAKNVPMVATLAHLHNEAKPGPHVLIEVSDTGTGMPPEVIERIFEPFFTTKELGKGTGLGLSTTIAIVKSHGGFVQVHSELGKGTQFRVFLPSETLATSLPAAADEDELPYGNGELVLVVDDEASVREITRQTLEAFGYRVLLASDGADAAALYATEGRNIAVVLTDMMMPVMDGLTTVQVLMRMNPQVKIIGASGLNADGMATKAALAGVKHFIPKPYAAGTLLKVLKTLLRG